MTTFYIVDLFLKKIILESHLADAPCLQGMSKNKLAIGCILLKPLTLKLCCRWTGPGSKNQVKDMLNCRELGAKEKQLKGRQKRRMSVPELLILLYYIPMRELIKYQHGFMFHW
jgi:hypothetical protein